MQTESLIDDKDCDQIDSVNYFTNDVEDVQLCKDSFHALSLKFDACENKISLKQNDQGETQHRVWKQSLNNNCLNKVNTDFHNHSLVQNTVLSFVVRILDQNILLHLRFGHELDSIDEPFPAKIVDYEDTEKKANFENRFESMK